METIIGEGNAPADIMRPNSVMAPGRERDISNTTYNETALKYLTLKSTLIIIYDYPKWATNRLIH